MRLLPAAALLISTAALAQFGVKYEAASTALCSWIVTKDPAAQKIGQLLTCPPDTSTPVQVAAAQPTVTAAAVSPSATARIPIGMNLAGLSYWSTEFPFVDRAKTTDKWILTDASGWRDYAGTLDANGYPSTPIKGAEFGAPMGVEDPALPPPDRWVLTWTGSARISRVLSGHVVSNQQGRVVFDAADFFVTPLWTGGTLTDLHLVRADQEDLLSKGEIFNPAFIAKASDWSVLRFMDWQNTNNLPAITWENRLTARSLSWTAGAPIEVMVELANKSHTDMWFNVPTQADDTYVRNALTLIRDTLDPALKVHVEYSNEPWNWAFPVAKTLERKAADLWGNDANKDGKIDVGTRAETLEGGHMVYYGYRAAQVANIAHEVFSGANASRVRTVLGAQTAWADLTVYYTLPGIARAQLGTVSSLFSEYAVTAYFGWGELNANDRQILLGWARSGAAGVTAAFRDLEFGGGTSTDLSLAAQVRFYAKQGAIAKANGLSLVAYEGGPHLVANMFSGQDQVDFLGLITRMKDDPRMAALLTKMADDFTTAGGTELTYFNDAGTWSKYGTWGLTDNIYQSSARYDALRAIAR